MRIDRESSLAGHPVLTIRELARRIRGGEVDARFAGEILDVHPTEARRVLEALQEQGYLEPLPIARPERPFWSLTVKGNALANASTAPPVKRSTAGRKLRELLGKVEQVRDDDRFLYRVERLVLFGSYLRDDQGRVGDLDIALDLQSKFEDRDERWAAEEEKRRAAREAGRHFQNYVVELSWPRDEVLLFLKSRSRTISLTNFSDQAEFFAGVPHEVIYEHPGPPREIP